MTPVAPNLADPGVAEMEAVKAEVSTMALPASLGDFIAERAATLGDRPACVYFQNGATLTYRDIDDQANRLANRLLAIGARKGSHIAVMLRNGPAFPPVWTAIGRVGAVMVPVNTSYTEAELEFVLTDSDAQFLIIDGDLLDTFARIENRPTLIADGNVIVNGNAQAPHRSLPAFLSGGSTVFEPPTTVTENDLLNIQYTSGTTGFPKGCMLTHRYWLLLSHSAAAMHDRFRLSNVLMWQPSYYMDGQWPMLLTFRLGGTAYIASRMSLSHFLDWIRDYEIHFCAFPEPLLKKAPPSPEDADTSLVQVNAFGWRGAAIEEFERRFGATARDAFGMTEIGVGTAMPKAATHMATAGSCGLPGPFREIKVVDEDGNEAPRGESGELWVAGDSLLWGYYKRPDANAEAFVGRWFRTGDLARQDENGYVFIVGRLKEMIKRSGENISAREVEAALREIDGIEEAAAVPVPDPTRREEVKAYLMLSAGHTPDQVTPEAVLRHCRSRLAAFKVPRYLAYVEDFPRTATRKIAKQQLIEAAKDLRVGSFDRVDGIWR